MIVTESGGFGFGFECGCAGDVLAGSEETLHFLSGFIYASQLKKIKRCGDKRRGDASFDVRVELGMSASVPLGSGELHRRVETRFDTSCFSPP